MMNNPLALFVWAENYEKRFWVRQNCWLWSHLVGHILAFLVFWRLNFPEYLWCSRIFPTERCPGNCAYSSARVFNQSRLRHSLVLWENLVGWLWNTISSQFFRTFHLVKGYPLAFIADIGLRKSSFASWKLLFLQYETIPRKCWKKIENGFSVFPFAENWFPRLMCVPWVFFGTEKLIKFKNSVHYMLFFWNLSGAPT